MIKSALAEINEKSPGFLVGLKIFERNQLESIESDPTQTPVFNAFQVSSQDGDACLSPDLSPFDLTVYHSGLGALPAIGEIVYEDEAGTQLFDTTGGLNGNTVQIGIGDYLFTGADGVRRDFVCE